MTKLPVIAGKEMIKLLERNGFMITRTRGSHVFLKKGGIGTVVPLHKDLDSGTLLGILKQCGMTKEDLDRLRNNE